MANFVLVLPECELLVGNQFIIVAPDTLTAVALPTPPGRRIPPPLWVLELTVKRQNQGNLVQFCGKTRRFAGNAKALLRLGKYWVKCGAIGNNGINLDVRQMKDFSNIKSRAGAGMLKSLPLRRSNGLYSTLPYAVPTRHIPRIFHAKKLHGYDFGERFTFAGQKICLRSSWSRLRNWRIISAMRSQLLLSIGVPWGGGR